MPTDEEIESKVHDAVVEEWIIGKKRIKINIEGLGDAFITKKILEKIPKKALPEGTKICVKVKRQQDDRLLVSEISSINNEPYTSPEPEPKKEKSKPKSIPKSKKPKAENKNKKPVKNKSKLWDSSRDPSYINRSILYEYGYPLAVPFSQLNNPDSMELIVKVLESNEQVLVTLFRENVEQTIEDKLLSKVKGMMGKITLQFVVDVNNKFPDYDVRLLNWPEIFRSQFDTKRSTHPYVSSRCRAAVIVSKNKSTEIKPFSDILFRAVHDEALSRSKNRWVILGDETGKLDEFRGLPQSRKSTMCWVAIPPGTKLPALDPEFHCSGTEGTPDYIEALSNLSSHENILYFSFAFEEGTIPKMNKIGKDPHLSFWKETLPLVLEKISNINKDKTKVDIFIEQVGPLESGIGVIQPIVSSLVTKFRNRQSWSNLIFDQMWVITKGEHPWIGYPDFVGQLVNQNKLEDEKMKKHLQNNQQMFNRIHKSPFRQKSLNGPILQALNDISRPLFFLQSLYSIEANDLRDYIRPFFGNAIQESLDSLNVDEWQDLLAHIDKKASESKKGQRVTALIHDYIDIDKSLEKLENSPYVQFDLLRMMLGTSNHRGAMAEGLRCKQICEKMFESGFEPTYEKRKKFENILPGLQDNMFNFNLENIEIPEYDKKMETQDIHKLGTIAQSLGLSGIEDNLDIAIQIESSLANHGDNRYHKARHSILLAELLTDKNEYSKAKEILDGIQYNSQNSFLFAAQLKCYSLGEFELPKDENYVEDFMKLLEEDHPSQRIAYWYARWALVNDKQAEEYTQQCIKHLVSLTDVPLFSHDAPGVILACELIDLAARGYKLEIDPSQFYEMVKSNSQPSTLIWLEQHPPNEDDWLAPLNFNYR